VADPARGTALRGLAADSARGRALNSGGGADDPVLVVDDLSRRFGEHEVVRRLRLTLAPGERGALVGPNGSGKSTVLRCVAGTLVPSSGHVAVASHSAGSPEAARAVGASLGHERSFYLRLTGRANLLFFARLRGVGRRAAARAVDRLADELELHEILRERADRCSTGMLQQLALARSLLDEPSLLVLDEPTRSLDEQAVARFWRALDSRPQTAVLLATHRLDEVERCAVRVDLPT